MGFPTGGFPTISVDDAAAVLLRGGVVAFPTETVYGLGAVARDGEAVARVFEVKGRPRFDPLIVHVSGIEMAREVGEFSATAEKLAGLFWPGPLTVVVRKREWVPGIVTAGLDTVGVRMPAHPVALALVRAVGEAIAAPSANKFGMVSPTSAAAVHEQFGDAVPVVDGGPCVVGVESTVVAVGDANEVEVLRPGAVTAEMLVAAGFEVRRGVAVHEQPSAPGMLRSHYSPGKRVVLLGAEAPGFGAAEVSEQPTTGLLAFHAVKPGYGVVEVLATDGSLTTAAANLFGALRRLGASRVKEIHAEPVPEEGIGRAIMDRLRRAAEA